MLLAGADVHIKDKYNQTALHYAVQSNIEKLCKLICHNRVDAQQTTKIAALNAKQYALKSVYNQQADTNFKSHCLKKDPLDNSYLIMRREMQKYEGTRSIFERDDAKYNEEKIQNLLQRYEDLDLSEIESEGDICEAGDIKKNKINNIKKRKRKQKADGAGKKKNKSKIK